MPGARSSAARAATRPSRRRRPAPRCAWPARSAPTSSGASSWTRSAAAGATVCLNAAPYRPLPGELAGLVDLLVVNAIEAEQLAGVAVTDLASAAAAARTLAGDFPSVVVTAGGDGVAGAQRGEEPVAL